MTLPHPVRLERGTRELLGVDPRDSFLWTPAKKYTWEKAIFRVGVEWTEEKVQDVAGPKYRNKFGDHLEGEGFTVLAMDGPYYDGSVVAAGTTDPDEKRYVIWAKVTRRPITTHVEVSDESVPSFLKSGYSLAS